MDNSLNLDDNYISRIKAALDQASNSYTEAERVGRNIDKLLDLRANNEIFVEVYEGKSSFDKLINMRYAGVAKKKLESTDEELEDLRGQYKEAVQRYNDAIKEIREANLYRRRNGGDLIWNY